MGDGDINQLVQKVLRGTFPNQKPHALKSGGSPWEENQASDADSADRVKEPDFLEFCSDDGHYQSENVDENIISVVELERKLASAVSLSQVIACHEYTSCWVAADKETVYEHDTFWEDCDGESVLGPFTVLRTYWQSQRRGVVWVSSHLRSWVLQPRLVKTQSNGN